MSTPGLEWERINFAFGDVLKVLRSERGLAPEDFAALFGMDVRYYLEIESAQWGPTLGLILRCARGLGRTPEELVTATVARMPGIDLKARMHEAKTARQKPKA